MNLAVVVLAAGEGTRMKSSCPKVLHCICGQPILQYVMTEIEKLSPKETVVVVGHQAEKVTPILNKKVKVTIQDEQRGTAHAVMMAESSLQDYNGTIMVTCGDTPLIRQETLSKLFQLHQNKKAVATLLSAILSDPTGYGRIIRKANGTVERIVEEKDASEKEKRVAEINSGIYCFEKEELFSAIKKINCENAQKEFYLTDVIEILNKQNKKVAVSVVEDSTEISGVNSRKELAQAQTLMQSRINDKLMEEGTTLIAPELTFIGPDVVIGRDTIVYPFSFLEGKTRIGKECCLGPSVHLIDVVIGDKVQIENVVAEDCVIEDEVNLGPFSRLRPGTRVKKGAKIGSYVEVKKSEVGEKSKIPHLSYIGDAVIGKNVNVGAGTITCNYDGVKKYQTIIEDDAFIGSDTMLVAPVKIGKNATVGAGSAISADVPKDSLALERTEQRIIKDWSKKKRHKKDKGKQY